MAVHAINESLASYIHWKGWQEGEFGHFDHRSARYYTWHVRRAVGRLVHIRVLELGFGNGAFLGYCRQQGWHASGVEIDEDLRDRAAHAGYLTAPSIQELPNADRYDLIALFDVLEHVPTAHLVHLMRALCARLTSQGAILVRVPNGDSPFGGRHQHGDLTHVEAFGEFKLRQLAAMCRLKLVELGEAPWYAQQGESRTFKALRRAVTRSVLNRLLGFAYFGKTVDLSSNLVAVLVPVGSTRAGLN